LFAGARRVCQGVFCFLPHAGVAAIWLWLVFDSGGYVPRTWLLPALTMALLALVLAATRIYPGQPGQLATFVIILFLCYALWTAASASWAESRYRVWLEATRVFFLLLVFWTAILCFKDTAGQKIFRYLLLLSNAALLALCLGALWSSESLFFLFAEGRFVYPVGNANSAAALFAVSFWPLMWLSAGPEERAPMRGLALGLATGLLGFALLTRSQGAVYGLALSALLAFVLSPARLRMLLHFLPLVLTITYAFPTLEKYWSAPSGDSAGPTQGLTLTGAQGARTLLIAFLVAAFCGMILAFLENWVKVTARMKTVFGIVVLAALLAGGSYGLVVATRDSRGPLTWFEHKIETVTTGTSASGSQGHPTTEPANPWLVGRTWQERLALWEGATSIFRASPVLGVGAGNFALEYDRTASTGETEPESPDSIVLQLLTETGVVGGILFFGPVALVAIGVLWPRVSAARKNPLTQSSPPAPEWSQGRWGNRPLEYGWPVALLCGSAYWLIHASVDGLWPVNAVTIPPIVFMACAVAHVDSRAGVLWPRVRNFFARLRHARSGLLARGFRVALALVACLVIIGAALPYAALRWEDAALAADVAEARKAIKQAGVASWLQPPSPEPYLAKGMIYEEQARVAATGESPGMAGAVLDNLALAISSYEKAASLEPSNWLPCYKTGAACLNLVVARAYLEQAFLVPPALDESPIWVLTDWSSLATARPPTDPGEGPGEGTLSLALTPSEISLVTFYRRTTFAELLAQTEDWLNKAFYLRPSAPYTRHALALLRTIRHTLR